MQHQVKEDMEQRVKSAVPEGELTMMQFTKSAYSKIEWIEHGEEFLYHGAMMDVVKKRTDENGNIIVYAIDDKKESKLCAGFNEKVKENSANQLGGKPTVKSVKLISNKYISSSSALLFADGSATTFLQEPQIFFKSFIKDNPSPPPEA